MNEKMNSNRQPSVNAAETELSNTINRRKFIGGVTTAALGVTLIPRHVLGGVGFIAPSDKINVAYIGCGTQGLREMQGMLDLPEIQIVAVCDPQKKAINYYDWDPQSLRDQIRTAIGNPNWTTGGNNTIPGGRDNAQEYVDGFYAKQRADQKFKGCRVYADFRELFEKEKGLDAVKIMTPDHLHGLIAMAAMKRNIAVTMHKPISNRLFEGRKVIDFAKNSKVITHLIPWDTNGNMDQIMSWINGGVIGTLKEVHNWSFRPVWPQYAKVPAEKPAVPDGFDWDLWVGPEADRPYHPYYTNMVFRGWYDFGGGSMADMGHYSLWTVFNALELENPTIIEPNRSHVCDLQTDATAYQIQNDFAFPFASTVRFKYPAQGNRPAVDLVWYDGGMKPPTPQEFYDKNIDFPEEGMMFVGDKGIIMSSAFTVEKPYLLSGEVKKAEEVSVAAGATKQPGVQRFVEGIKTGKQIDGNFRQAWPITEAVNLYAAALRANKTLRYDASQLKIINDDAVNKYLQRTYRSGWNIDSI
jgi:Predicted dehydrogenases and related proteins